MVIQRKERNLFDQWGLVDACQDKGVRVLRITMDDIAVRGRLDNNRLFIDDREVSVVYFRSCYTPDDYLTSIQATPLIGCSVPDDVAKLGGLWPVRYMLEISMAIKCPSIQYQVAGTKKVHQVMAESNVLEQFFENEPERAERIRQTFAGLYSLTPIDENLLKHVIEHPHDYVMKPQREGGGNLKVNDQMVKLLMERDQDVMRSHILMSRICPVPHKTAVVKDGAIVGNCLIDCISEFGVFGVILADDTTEYYNYEAGYLVRTKPADVEDGGVAAGVAMMDSLVLV